MGLTAHPLFITVGPAEKEKRRMKMQRQMNDKLKAIGKKLGFEEKLVLNLARHSYATHLLISNIPVSHISSSLGHSSQKTTEHYLKSLPSSVARDISNTLLNFNEPKL